MWDYNVLSFWIYKNGNFIQFIPPAQVLPSEAWRVDIMQRKVMEKAAATDSSTLAWKIPWIEESGRLQSMRSRSRTRLSDFTFTFHFHALEKEMATHSSVLAWRVPGTGDPGGLLSMGSHRVGHDWSDLAAAAATEKSEETLIFFIMTFPSY